MPMLVVDNLSPYTPDILACLAKLDVAYVYKKYSEVTDVEIAACDKVILSGRRKNSKEINVVNSRIVRQCCDDSKALLGICYGAEIIALTFGGSIRKMPSHVHGTTDVTVFRQNPLTGGKSLISAFESHGYCVAKLPAIFSSLATSQYCEHEIFSSGKIYGTQFHPEKSGADGMSVLENFSKL